MRTFAEINWRRQHAHATIITGDPRTVLTADYDYPGPYPEPPGPRTSLESMAAAWEVLSAERIVIDPCPVCGTPRHSLGMFKDHRRVARCDNCEAWTPAPAKEEDR